MLLAVIVPSEADLWLKMVIGCITVVGSSALPVGLFGQSNKHDDRHETAANLVASLGGLERLSDEYTPDLVELVLIAILKDDIVPCRVEGSGDGGAVGSTYPATVCWTSCWSLAGSSRAALRIQSCS